MKTSKLGTGSAREEIDMAQVSGAFSLTLKLSSRSRLNPMDEVIQLLTTTALLTVTSYAIAVSGEKLSERLT